MNPPLQTPRSWTQENPLGPETISTYGMGVAETILFIGFGIVARGALDAGGEFKLNHSVSEFPVFLFVPDVVHLLLCNIPDGISFDELLPPKHVTLV